MVSQYVDKYGFKLNNSQRDGIIKLNTKPNGKLAANITNTPESVLIIDGCNTSV